MRSLLLFSVWLAAVSGLAVNLGAQERAVGAELWGRVLLAGDTVGVPGAVVELEGLSIRAITSRTGFYRLAGLRPGPRALRVRLLGYTPVTQEITLEDGRTDRRDIRLERLPNLLTEVRIEGQLRKVPPRFNDVYRRMAAADGKFFTREDIERLNPTDIESLLMQVATVRVTFDGIKFVRCNDEGSLVLSRGAGKVQIYIDGNRMTGRITSVAAGNPDFNEQREVLKMVPPSQVQAIEIYSGVARIPGEFLDDACAVIAIWTRSY